MCPETIDVRCTQLEDTTVFAVKRNGNVYEMKVRRKNGDYIHQLIVDRDDESLSSVKRKEPFWVHPWNWEEFGGLELLVRVAQQAMADGDLQKTCHDCHSELETNGKPQFVRCEHCMWWFCPDCFPHFVTPHMCWNCWREHVLSYKKEFDLNGKKVKGIDKEHLAVDFFTWCRVLRFTEGREHTYWIYDWYEKIWKNDGEEKIEVFFYSTLRTKFVKGVKSYLMGFIRATATCDRADVELLPPEIIPVANGFIDWKDGGLVKDFDGSKYFYTKRHPINFYSHMDCPRFRQFLEEALDNEDERLTLIEWLGYNLLRDFPFHKFMVLYGVGSNGKGTFLKVLEKMLGTEFVSAIDIFQISDNRFAPSNLYLKNANIHADLNDAPITNTGMLKTLTGGDMVSVEKKRKDHFEFENYAKLTFSTNHILEIKDQSKGLRRRPMLVEFPNEFEENPNLKHELEAELPGIFNLALEGLRRLMENGKFSLQRTYDDLQEDYIFCADPVQRFMSWCLKDGGEAPVDEVYGRYLDILDMEGGKPVGKSTLTKAIKTKFPRVRTKRGKPIENFQRNNKGKIISRKVVRKWTYIGVSLKTVEEQMLDGLEEDSWQASGG